LTTKFLVSRLAIKTQKNDHYEDPVLLHILFMGYGQKESLTDQNQKPVTKWSNKLKILIKLFLYISYGKVLSQSAGPQQCLQNAGYCVEM
jgi:hypothetical protein